MLRSAVRGFWRRGRVHAFSGMIALVFGVGLGMSLPSRADSPPILQFDPFRAKEEKVVVASPTERGRVERVFRPILQSTMVGEKNAHVMLGGVALKVGESTNGYRLVAVGTFDAVFMKDGERIRLEVDRGRGDGR